MPSALVVGEALIDIVHPAEGHPVRAVGGSPLNVAVGLSRLGVSTSILTDIGEDADGDVIAARLAEEGVGLRPGSRRAGPTSTAIARLDGTGQARYSFDVRWSPSGDGQPRLDAVHVGSYAAFLAPGDDVVLQQALAAKQAGRLLTFDPNIRPALLPARGQVELRFLELVGCADVVKLSKEDAEHLFPGSTRDDVLDHLLSCGPRLVVMTAGAAGAELRSRTATLVRAAEPVAVVDTIGAGDSYMAALIHGLLTPGDADDLEHLDDRALARLADHCAVASAVTAGRRGAEPPSLADLRSRTERDTDSTHPSEETHVRA